MKERPILLTAVEVQGLLDLKRTQLRRMMKPQPNSGPKGEMVDLGSAWALSDGCLSGEWKCPYGKPGDRLWVRESFQPLLDEKLGADPEPNQYNYKNGHGYCISYPATDGIQEFYDMGSDHAFCSRITPSIHMPRWASRFMLEITDVRVQRLQDISDDDCRAEGYSCADGRVRNLFAAAWNDLNGLVAKKTNGWNTNCFVWAITFKAVQP